MPEDEERTGSASISISSSPSSTFQTTTVPLQQFTVVVVVVYNVTIGAIGNIDGNRLILRC